MLDAYDKIVKCHIQSFLTIDGKTKKQIKVYGLQNEDESNEAVMSQAGAENDKVEFPLVSVFRKPTIEVTDDSVTKRVSNYDGYTLLSDESGVGKLNCMRCTLQYAADVYAENKKTCEDIGTQLYFRLRNNPQLDVQIILPVKNSNGEIVSATCTTDIVMGPNMTHLRSQLQTDSQLYKLRLEFSLKNCNIYDVTFRQFQKIEYSVVAKIDGSQLVLLEN